MSPTYKPMLIWPAGRRYANAARGPGLLLDVRTLVRPAGQRLHLSFDDFSRWFQTDLLSIVIDFDW